MTNNSNINNHKAYQRCYDILDEGINNAHASSLYESPVDILFITTSLLFSLIENLVVKKRSTEPFFEFYAVITDESDHIVCSWSNPVACNFTLSNDFSTYDGDETRYNEDKNTYFLQKKLTQKFFLKLKLHYDKSQLSTQENDLPLFIQRLITEWHNLANKMGGEFCIKAGTNGQNNINGCINQTIKKRIERTFNSRLREGFQHIEEELPINFRVSFNKIGEPIPSQLYFLKKSIPSNSHSVNADEQAYLSYLLTHEDLRLLQDWINDNLCFVQRLRKAAVTLAKTSQETNILNVFIAQFEITHTQTWLQKIRQIYEQVQLPSNNVQSNVHSAYSTFFHGYPSICYQVNHQIVVLEHRNKNTLLIALIEMVLLQGQPKEETNTSLDRNIIFWPISFMGEPSLAVHFSFYGQNPLIASDDEFEQFFSLIRSFYRIREASWNLLFELYFDLIIDGFRDIYLHTVMENNKGGDTIYESGQLKKLMEQLNGLNAYLRTLLNVQVFNWCTKKDSENDFESLWQIQSEMEVIEDRSFSETIDQDEEERLLILQQEQGILSQIGIEPVLNLKKMPPELQFMYHHLSWRIGHYIRYSLPSLLMAVAHRSNYEAQRQVRILRHEIAGLIGKSRSLVLEMNDQDKTTVQDDLRVLLRVLQGTMQSVDEKGIRSSAPLPSVAMKINEFIETLQRIFVDQFILTDKHGLPGICKIYNFLPQSCQINIAEEDFYAIWKNLWKNARQILIENVDKNVTERINQPVLLGVLSLKSEQGKQLVHFDVLDNSPQLSTQPIKYPDRIKAGHYGLQVIQTIIEQLSKQTACYYIPVQPLNKQHRIHYEQFDVLQGYHFEQINNWSYTSVRLQTECSVFN